MNRNLPPLALACTLLAFVVIPSPKLTAQAQENPSHGTSQELGEIEPRTVQDLPWGMGGNYPETSETEASTFNNNLLNLEPAEGFTFDPSWTTTGDENGNSAAIPLVNF